MTSKEKKEIKAMAVEMEMLLNYANNYINSLMGTSECAVYQYIETTKSRLQALLHGHLHHKTSPMTMPSSRIITKLREELSDLPSDDDIVKALSQDYDKVKELAKEAIDRSDY